MFNAQGGLTVKLLDRHNEKSISVVNWHAAARATEDHTHVHHGIERAEALAAHHRQVMDLACSHTWDTVMDYDIQQRDTVALNPMHDLSTLDLAALTIIATFPVLSISGPSSSPSKHSLQSDSMSQPPHKRQHSHCFQCGRPDHFPSNCKAEFTSAGKAVAKLAPSAKSKHAMLVANGKQFCFSWARTSTCNFSSACSNFHSCSICGKTGHGAGGCKAQA